MSSRQKLRDWYGYFNINIAHNFVGNLESRITKINLDKTRFYVELLGIM